MSGMRPADTPAEAGLRAPLLSKVGCFGEKLPKLRGPWVDPTANVLDLDDNGALELHRLWFEDVHKHVERPGSDALAKDLRM